MQRYGPYVPTKLLLPYIEEFLRYHTVTQLEAITGLPARAIWDMRIGRRPTVRFDTADRLLTRLELINEWRDNPDLSEIYEAA